MIPCADIVDMLDIAAQACASNAGEVDDDVARAAYDDAASTLRRLSYDLPAVALGLFL